MDELFINDATDFEEKDDEDEGDCYNESFTMQGAVPVEGSEEHAESDPEKDFGLCKKRGWLPTERQGEKLA